MTDIETDNRVVAGLGLGNTNTGQRLVIEKRVVSPMPAAMTLAQGTRRARDDGMKSLGFWRNGRWLWSLLGYPDLPQHIAEVLLEPFHTGCADQY